MTRPSNKFESKPFTACHNDGPARCLPRTDQSEFKRAYLGQAEKNGLDPEETVTQLMTLIVGGIDTTRAALVMQMSLLLQHREQWNLLCMDPSLVRKAVAEALRFEPFIGSFARIARNNVIVANYAIPAGTLLSMSTLSALRDEDIYAEPERFDIERDQPKWHPVFGIGAHRCLGEALAGIELEEMLGVLFTHIPDCRPRDRFPAIIGFGGVRRVEPFQIGWQIDCGLMA